MARNAAKIESIFASSSVQYLIRSGLFGLVPFPRFMDPSAVGIVPLVAVTTRSAIAAG